MSVYVCVCMWHLEWLSVKGGVSSTSVYVHVYVYVCRGVYAFVVFARVYLYRHACIQRVCFVAHACICADISVCVCVCVCVCAIILVHLHIRSPAPC